MIPAELALLVRDVPDFPKPGIVFRDLTPLFANAEAMRCLADALCEPWNDAGCTKVVGIEARGFLLAPLVAERLGAGVVPVRKVGKLPFTTRRVDYALEYGTDTLEIHSDALAADDVVVVIDDVLATGGTAAGVAALVGTFSARLAGFGFAIELGFIGGRAALDRVTAGAAVRSVLTYP